VLGNLPSDVGKLEINLVADVLHGREDHIVQAVSRIRALRHDEGFEGHTAGRVGSVVLIPNIDRDDGNAEDHEEEEQAGDAENDSPVPFSRC
jgi:hypothetical protein